MERFNGIIMNAIKITASDVYITGGQPVVFRKDGQIQFQGSIGFSPPEVDALVNKLLNTTQLKDLKERKSCDVGLFVNHVRLRVNIFTTTSGLSLAIRLLPGHIPTIDELNIHPSLHDIAKLKSGLILYCGATGAGKSTTIAATVNDINKTRPAHIITLENPIEYRFPTIKAFIQQRELGTHMPSFAQGLLDVLRESPDVIVVGELRESEVMQLTINAAEAGHLVIATMHASTPEETIYRLCNSVPMDSQDEMRYQLASTLKWLIVQHLVQIDTVGFRVPLLTIVRASTSVKNIIRENKLHQLHNAISTGQSEGMFTSERYLTEYLQNRQKFTHPGTIFRPSVEKLNDAIYQSPLLEDKPEIKSRRRRQAERVEDAAIRQISHIDRRVDTEHVLDIAEGSESLDAMMKRLHSNESGE